MIILKNKTLKIKNQINERVNRQQKERNRWQRKDDKEQERKFERKKVVLENIEKRYFDFVLLIELKKMNDF